MIAVLLNILIPVLTSVSPARRGASSSKSTNNSEFEGDLLPKKTVNIDCRVLKMLMREFKLIKLLKFTPLGQREVYLYNGGVPLIAGINTKKYEYSLTVSP